MNDPYENLASAIVLSAVQDYRQALRILSHFPYQRDASNEKGSVLRFFHSGWFRTLTSIDPEFLIRELDKEVAA